MALAYRDRAIEAKGTFLFEPLLSLPLGGAGEEGRV